MSAVDQCAILTALQGYTALVENYDIRGG